MPLRHIGILTAAALVGAALTVTPASAISHHGNGDKPMASCNDLHMSFDDRPATIKSEERTLAKSEVRTLEVKANDNGGVQISGWDKDTYGITICKAAGGTTEEAERRIAGISVSTDGGRISTKGPHADKWSVYLLINIPKAVSVSLDGRNGPVSIFDVDGNLTVRIENGPLSMRNFSGEANVQAENGPIDLTGASGNIKIHAQNGPISIALQGKTWNGSGLTVEGQNGPLDLSVPDGFESSFVVESRGNGPVSCKAHVCGSAAKTWDDDRKRIEFGKGPATIQLSTVNGPVAVSQGR